MDPVEAQRAIAALHSFRFFGLVFLIPGVVGHDLPQTFAAFAAYGDFATGILAMLALLTVGMRPLFWLFVAAFNVVGAADMLHHVAVIARSGADLSVTDQLGPAPRRVRAVREYPGKKCLPGPTSLLLLVELPTGRRPHQGQPL